jgi:hypothetical protein
MVATTERRGRRRRRRKKEVCTNDRETISQGERKKIDQDEFKVADQFWSQEVAIDGAVCIIDLAVRFTDNVPSVMIGSVLRTQVSSLFVQQSSHYLEKSKRHIG